MILINCIITEGLRTVLTGVAIVSSRTAAGASETLTGPVVVAQTVLCTVKSIFPLWADCTCANKHTHVNWIANYQVLLQLTQMITVFASDLCNSSTQVKSLCHTPQWLYHEAIKMSSLLHFKCTVKMLQVLTVEPFWFFFFNQWKEPWTCITVGSSPAQSTSARSINRVTQTAILTAACTSAL